MKLSEILEIASKYKFEMHNTVIAICVKTDNEYSTVKDILAAAKITPFMLGELKDTLYVCIFPNGVNRCHYTTGTIVDDDRYRIIPASTFIASNPA